MSRLVATFFYVGLMRPAPGTWGSAAAIPAAWLLHWAGGPLLLALASVAAFVAGVWATARQTAASDDPDPSEIVIDEVVGQWIALLPLSAGLWWMGSDPWAFPWPVWLLSFLLFRLFDIAKPGPIGWADRRHDPLGVMLDDVIAGVCAALGVLALGAALQWVFAAWEIAAWLL